MMLLYKIIWIRKQMASHVILLTNVYPGNNDDVRNLYISGIAKGASFKAVDSLYAPYFQTGQRVLP